MSKRTVDWSSKDFERKFGDGDKLKPQRFTGSALAAVARNAMGEADADGNTVIDLVAIDPNRLEADIADGVEAITWLLYCAGFPSSLRPFIDCLIGLAGEYATDESDGWFEASHLKIGRRVRQSAESGGADAAAEAWAGRHYKSLKTTQYALAYEFFQIEESEFDRVKRITRPTRYRLPLLRFASDVLTRARASATWAKDSRRAIEEAARVVLDAVPDAPFVKERRSSEALDPASRLARNRKTIMTLLAKCAEDVRLIGLDSEQWLGLYVEDSDRNFRQASLRSIGDAELFADKQGTEPDEPEGVSNSYPPFEATEEPIYDERDGDATDEVGGIKSVSPLVGRIVPFPTRGFAVEAHTEGGVKSVAPSLNDDYEQVEPDTYAVGVSCDEPGGYEYARPSEEEGQSITEGDEMVSENLSYDARLTEINRRARAYLVSMSQRHPPRTEDERRAGCIEFFIDSVNPAVPALDERLAAVKRDYARGEATAGDVEAALRQFADAHLCVWKGGVPRWKTEGSGT